MLGTIGNGLNSGLAHRLHGTRESRAAVLAEIDALKRERNAVILAHYYQDPAVQDLADHLGDSLALARKAQETEADVIVFCGVHFMAETAKILNPARTVVLPDLAAGCSLADSCPAGEFEAFIAANPGHVVISYVNTTAAVKALSDIICTSSNARAIIDSIPADQPIIFGPDKHLGRYLVNQTGREMKLWQGTCMVHVLFSERKIAELKLRHPEAEMLAHPECEDQVLALADFIGSTTEIINRSAASDASTFIVATEAGVIHQMQQLSPGKTFLRAPGEGSADGACEACDECPHMRLNTVEKVRDCLRDLTPQIHLQEEVRLAAHRPIQRMLALS